MSSEGTRSHEAQHFLKRWHLQTSQPSPTSPESQSSQPSMHTDPAACRSISFHCGPSNVKEENGSDLELWHQKGQTSKEIINSTWATSAPTQWKGPRTNPRKGHGDQRSQAEKGNSEGLPAAIGVNVVLITLRKGRGLSESQLGSIHNICVFKKKKSQVFLFHCLSKRLFLPASRAQETKNCRDKIILASTVSCTGALKIFKITAAYRQWNSKKWLGRDY